MDCAQSRNLLSSQLDMELDAPTAQRLRAHLDACPECRAIRAQLLDVGAAVAQHATRYSAPAPLRRAILDAVRAQQPRRRPLADWPWAWINLAAAAASSAAFAATLLLYVQQPSDTERLSEELVASHFRSLMPDHLADVISTDQHTVKPWFAGKLDYSPPVQDLARQGFALVGGRLDYVDQRPVAALAYRHRLHIINLYVWPDKTGHDAAPRAMSRQGFQLLQWTQAGMHYSAISDMNAQELAQFQQLLSAHAGS